jgi:hypothetical protein
VDLLMFFVSLLFSFSAAAQPQVVNFKELQQFLPQGDIQNYVRGKTDGETSTMMGFVTSWAQVTYSSSPDSNRGTISVKITDLLNIPSYMSIMPSAVGNPNLSPESGYKKTVTYNNMNVFETYDSTAHQAKLQFTLATRFLIEISGSGVTNASVLYTFLDKTDTAGLEKAAQANSGSQGR